MMKLTIIANRDADSAIASALAMNMLKADKEETWILTSSYRSILKSIGLTIMKGPSPNLFIAGINPFRKGVLASGAFDRAIWCAVCDTDEDMPRHDGLELYIDPNAPSVSSLLPYHDSSAESLIAIANQLFSGRASTTETRMLQGIMDYINTIPKPRERDENFSMFVKTLSFQGINTIAMQPFLGWYEAVQEVIDSRIDKVLSAKEVRNMHGKRIAYFEDAGALPTHSIIEALHRDNDIYDYLVFRNYIETSTPMTNLEFHTMTDMDVLSVAQMIGGTGRRSMAMATVEGDFTMDSVFSLLELIPPE